VSPASSSSFSPTSSDTSSAILSDLTDDDSDDESNIQSILEFQPFSNKLGAVATSNSVLLDALDTG
jgi:hypothetical protein